MLLEQGERAASEMHRQYQSVERLQAKRAWQKMPLPPKNTKLICGLSGTEAK
jgi:hypothetical protein